MTLKDTTHKHKKRHNTKYARDNITQYPFFPIRKLSLRKQGKEIRNWRVEMGRLLGRSQSSQDVTEKEKPKLSDALSLF